MPLIPGVSRYHAPQVVAQIFDGHDLVTFAPPAAVHEIVPCSNRCTITPLVFAAWPLGQPSMPAGPFFSRYFARMLPSTATVPAFDE